MGPEYKLGAWQAAESGTGPRFLRESLPERFLRFFCSSFARRNEHSSILIAALASIHKAVLQRLKPLSLVGVYVVAEATTYKELFSTEAFYKQHFNNGVFGEGAFKKLIYEPPI